MSKRNPSVLGVWGPRGRRVVAAESYWQQPLKWNADAERAGERRRVFCASLADVFEGEDTMPAESWPLVQQARGRLWALIEQTPHLDWLLLTKRPENALALATAWAGGPWPANVWVGTSVENQAAADERIPHLLNVPARVRFLSCEPLLGPVNLRSIPIDARTRADVVAGAYIYTGALSGSKLTSVARIQWVIAGGESGPHARPMLPDWARSLRNQCSASGVAFFFKQHGEWLPFETKRDENGKGTSIGIDGRQIYIADLLSHAHQINDDRGVVRLGKHAAGRLLDGREWNEFPVKDTAK